MATRDRLDVGVTGPRGALSATGATRLSIRPIQRLDRRTGQWVRRGAGAALVVSLLFLGVALVSDGGDLRAARNDDNRAIADLYAPLIDGDVDHFDGRDGSSLSRFPGRPERWRVLAGDPALFGGLLVVPDGGEAVMTLEDPERDRVVQVIFPSDTHGWTLAFGYRGAGDYWGVGLTPGAASVEVVSGGSERVLHRDFTPRGPVVEVVMVRRGGQVSVKVNGRSQWSGPAPAIDGVGRLALIAQPGAAGGLQLLGLRAL